MRDSAGELADDLHLGRLRDLPLQLGFLAVVLEEEQHGSIAEAAEAGDRQRDGLRSLASEAHGKIARHGGPARVAADRIRHGGLVFLDDQVAGIDWHRRTLDPRRLAEGLVHGDEAAVAIDQRQSDGKDVEQGLEVRGVGERTFLALEQHEEAGAALVQRVGGNVHRPERPRGIALEDEAHLFLFADLDQICEIHVAAVVAGLDRAFEEQSVSCEQPSVGVDHGGQHPRRGQPVAGCPLDPPRGQGQRIERWRIGEAPQEQVALRADTLDLDRRGSGNGGHARHAAGAVAPCHGPRHAERLGGIVVLAELDR